MQKYKNNSQLHSTQTISDTKKLTNITLGIHLIKITFFHKKEQNWVKSFSFIGPYVWQKIPLELKGLPLSKFKTKLKQHLISKY